MIGVEKQHEHARARVLRGLPAFFDRVRLAARFLRDVSTNQNAFELLEFLWLAVLEDVEVVTREIVHRRAALRRIRIDADVIGLGPERWELRLRGRLSHRRDGNEHGDQP